MHYYLYQITNKVNSKIYVGVHKTKSLDDGYMGSGKVVRSAVMKHGVENFEKVILEHFDTSEAMYAREAEVVNDEFLAREDVYNIRRGGFGGFEHINKNGLNGFSLSKETALKGRQTSDRILQERYGSNWRQVLADKAARGYRDKLSSDEEFAGRMFDALKKASIASVTPEANKKRSETMKQKASSNVYVNSQAGTMWITNEELNKKIKNTDPIPEGWRKGRVSKVLE